MLRKFCTVAKLTTNTISTSSSIAKKNIFSISPSNKLFRISSNVLQFHLSELVNYYNNDYKIQSSDELKNIIFSVNSIDDKSIAINLLNKIKNDRKYITPEILTLLLQCCEKKNVGGIALDYYKIFSNSIDNNLTSIKERHLISLFKTMICNKYNDRKLINDQVIVDNIKLGISIYRNALEDKVNFPTASTNNILLSSIINLCNSLSKYIALSNPDILDTVLEFIDLFINRGIKPHHSIYGTVLILAGKTNRFDIAEKLNQDMTNSGLAKTIYSQTVLMSAAQHCNNHYKAIEIYKDMLNNELIPSSRTMCKVLDSCQSINQNKLALQLYIEWVKNRGISDWDVCRSVFSLLINANNNCNSYQINKTEIWDRSYYPRTKKYRPNLELMSEELNNNKLSSEEIELKQLTYLQNTASKMILSQVRKSSKNNQTIPPDILLSIAREVALNGDFEEILNIMNNDSNFGSISLEKNAILWKNLAHSFSNRGHWRSIISLSERIKSYEKFWSINIRNNINSSCISGLFLCGKVEIASNLIKSQIISKDISEVKDLFKSIFKSMKDDKNTKYIHNVINVAYDKNVMSDNTFADALYKCHDSVDVLSCLKIVIDRNKHIDTTTKIKINSFHYSSLCNALSNSSSTGIKDVLDFLNSNKSSLEDSIPINNLHICLAIMRSTISENFNIKDYLMDDNNKLDDKLVRKIHKSIDVVLDIALNTNRVNDINLTDLSWGLSLINQSDRAIDLINKHYKNNQNFKKNSYKVKKELLIRLNIIANSNNSVVKSLEKSIKTILDSL